MKQTFLLMRESLQHCKKQIEENGGVWESDLKGWLIPDEEEFRSRYVSTTLGFPQEGIPYEDTYELDDFDLESFIQKVAELKEVVARQKGL